MGIDVIEIIERYYGHDTDAGRLLIKHSRQVADMALAIAGSKPELGIDTEFVREAAMLHDIGIYLTDAPDIYCHGSEPYIKHGILGRELLDTLGLPRHALVCERHTGAGLSLKEIEAQALPVPHREMVPVSLEEQVVCFADKFFSKTRLDAEKSVEKARKSLVKYGEEGVARFDGWCREFL